MPLFPTYEVNGVPMQDAAGRWHEHPKMQVLPAHPGLRVNAMELAGLDGESYVGRSPLEPQVFTLKLVVNSVDGSGVRPRTTGEQLAQMQRNMDALYRAFQLPRMTGNGLARITMRLSATESRFADALLIGSVDVDRESWLDYAEVSFVFRIPSGKWRGLSTSQRIITTDSPFGHRGIVPGLKWSTAPINDAYITISGSFDWMQIMNEFTEGFRYDHHIDVGQAVTINTRTWKATDPYPMAAGADLATVPPAGDFHYCPYLSQVGEATGSALILWPKEEGATIYAHGDGRTPGSTYCYVDTREAFI